jgi:hypothetical protein
MGNFMLYMYLKKVEIFKTLKTFNSLIRGDWL